MVQAVCVTRVRALALTVRATGIAGSAGKRGDASGRAFYEAPGAVGGEGLRTWREGTWETWLETWECRATGGTEEMLVRLGTSGCRGDGGLSLASVSGLMRCW